VVKRGKILHTGIFYYLNLEGFVLLMLDVIMKLDISQLSVILAIVVKLLISQSLAILAIVEKLLIAIYVAIIIVCILFNYLLVIYE